nr:battenin isoform X2 [Paramormyrops kingsleyae]
MDRLERLFDGEGRWISWRNIAGFWWLGLCNNFAYVVMLSAAHDILKQQETNGTEPVRISVNFTRAQRNRYFMEISTAAHSYHLDRGNSSSSSYDCNPVSTAAVLLADILPTLLIKAVAPFFIHQLPYGFRVLMCIATATASFLLVSFSSSVAMSILGVVFASISSGLGELSFLSLTVFFPRFVLGGWGSGTGGAGVAGALLYAAFTQAGLSPRETLLVMLVVPIIMAASYYLLLVFPASFPQWHCVVEEGRTPNTDQERRPLVSGEENEEIRDGEAPEDSRGPLTYKDRLAILRGLLRFIIPLGVVYFAEYFINQGLLELLYFPGFSLSHAEQYRWYQTVYQIGVFVSRSSLFCVKIRGVWLMSVLQCINALLLFFAVYYHILSNAILVFVIVAYEGLLGGAAYVNTFHFISKETGDREREFAMAAASVGDSFGIALSAALSFPVHNYFCSL